MVRLAISKGGILRVLTTRALSTALAGFAVASLAGAALASPSSYHVVDRIPGPDGGWDYASYDPVGDRVFVARSKSVSAFDLKTRKVNGEMTPADRGHAALIAKGQLVVTNGTSGAVAFFNPETGAALASVTVGQGPDFAVVDSKSGYLLVMNHIGGDVVEVGLDDHLVKGRIAVGGALEAAVVDGHGRAFVNIENKNQIAVIDLPGQKVVGRYDLKDCDSPTGLAYTGRDLVVACNGAAEVIRADSGALLSRIKIGEGADGVAYDPGRKLAFVPSGRTGTLSVIKVDGKSTTLLDTVSTAAGARTIAIDPASGRIFLPAATFSPSTGPGARPGYVPDSFNLIVLAP